eukprot:CAMPEP_0172920300 /NCGR_PEP_ID=MMETSP1075-20121228/203803_1 /TAXON_ID=2916 /ORGANISM="Ceratium fusus, Strain PA161109" /LENGTH=55 /DNA_ID=CAMNT_0013780295 /DNA_START=75 /DNA_END=238 /DNA_ORIENTATION=-
MSRAILQVPPEEHHEPVGGPPAPGPPPVCGTGAEGSGTAVARDSSFSPGGNAPSA